MFRSLVVTATCATISASAVGSTLSVVIEGDFGSALPGHTFHYEQVHSGEQVNAVPQASPRAIFGQGEEFVADGWEQSDAMSMLKVFDASGTEVFAYSFDGFDANDAFDGTVTMDLNPFLAFQDRGTVTASEHLADGSRVRANFSFLAPDGSLSLEDPLQPGDFGVFEQFDFSFAFIEVPGLGAFDSLTSLNVTNVEVSTVVIPLPPGALLGAAGLSAVVMGRRRLGTERWNRRTAV